MSQDGKALLDKLQRPLTPGSADSLTASANYSKAVHHVLDIIHEVLHHQRQLENIWQHRKLRLHQRLQLCVFQQDVQQVTHTHTLTLFVFIFVVLDLKLQTSNAMRFIIIFFHFVLLRWNRSQKQMTCLIIRGQLHGVLMRLMLGNSC